MVERPRVYRVKVILLGDGGVGKTSLIRQYVQRAFSEDYLKTLGTSISKRTEEFTLEGGATARVDMTIWDIMGQKQLFELIQEAYLKGAHGVLAVFDVTRRQTIDSLKGWIKAARGEDPSVPILVLGNKADLGDRRAVTDGEASEFCRGLGLQYFPASAKTGLNVEVAFKALARTILGEMALIRG